MFTIGNYKIENPYILAPMAGVSQMPFRRLALEMGASLAPTELVSAKGLFYESVRTKSYLIHDQAIETPFCVQLFGGEAESMARAAEIAVAMGAHIIDINMGCPVKKVTKIHAGSALLCDYERAALIVRSMLERTSYKVPITVKIRSGWDNDRLNFLEVAKALEEAGVSAIAIHARTRAQGYSGNANWSHIGELKAHVRIPVIGNGDVTSVALAQKMQRETGCDGVMIGRAALGNPWIFRELCQGKESLAITAQERHAVISKHLADHIELCQRVSESEANKNYAFDQMQAIRSFRSHLIWYSKGLSKSAKFRTAIMASECPHESSDLIDEFFLSAKDSHELEPHEDSIDYRQAFG